MKVSSKGPCPSPGPPAAVVDFSGKSIRIEPLPISDRGLEDQQGEYQAQACRHHGGLRLINDTLHVYHGLRVRHASRTHSCGAVVLL